MEYVSVSGFGFFCVNKILSEQKLIFDDFDVADGLLWSHEVGGLVYTVGVHRIGQKIGQELSSGSNILNTIDTPQQLN